jgi:hypothetical protein
MVAGFHASFLEGELEREEPVGTALPMFTAAVTGQSVCQVFPSSREEAQKQFLIRVSRSP